MIAHRKVNIHTLIRHSIYLMRVFLIMRTWILSQNILQYLNLTIRQPLFFQILLHLFRYLHIQFCPFSIIHKSAAGIRMTIGIYHIRLDVIDRRAIHQVSSLHMNHRSLAGLPLYPGDSHGRQADVVRTKRTAGSEYTHLFIAAQNRRANHRTIRLVPVCRKLPYHATW